MTNPAAGSPDLSLAVAGIRLQNPVMVASGTFGYGPEFAELIDLNRLGAIVVKGISIEPEKGNPTPRMLEVPGGLLNAIGLQNPGFEKFVAEYMPFLRGLRIPLIVNIWGRTIEQYGNLAARFDAVPGVSALEINISCPNIKQGGLTFGSDPRLAAAVISAVRKSTRLPIIPKLPPNTSDMPALARAAEDAGANAISLVNSFPAMAIDIRTRRPILANITGGLSGPAIHTIAVKLVWEAAKAVRVPIIAMGGIAGPEEAIEFLIAGASAVAVGTANFTDPETALRVIEGIRGYLAENGIPSVRDLVGSLRLT